jgi:hypothetical protein
MFKPVEIFVAVFLVVLIAWGIVANVNRNDERAFRFAECSGRSLDAYKACVARVEGSGE